MTRRNLVVTIEFEGPHPSPSLMAKLTLRAMAIGRQMRGVRRCSVEVVDSKELGPLPEGWENL